MGPAKNTDDFVPLSRTLNEQPSSIAKPSYRLERFHNSTVALGIRLQLCFPELQT
jgi:hypothetical protein